MDRFLCAALLLAGALALCGTAQAADGPKVFRVDDYGARAGSAEDAGPALRRAVAAAMEAGGLAVVQLGPGRYRLKPPEGGIFCATLQGAKDVTVQGVANRTLLLLAHPRAAGFMVTGSERVVVRDLAIDYDPVPFTQGRIAAVHRDSGAFDLELDEGYPSLAEPWFRVEDRFGRWGMIFDRQKRRLKSNAPDHVFMDSWEPVQGRTWRMRVSEASRGALGAMEPGDRFVHMARVGYGCVFVQFSRACAVENVTVHASSGLAVALVGNEESVTVRRLQVRFPRGTSRLLTTDSDGVHCQQNRCGPLIEECYFEGMADDAVNIYAPAAVVTAAPAPDRLVVTGGGRVLPGDVMQVFDPREGVVRAEARVVSATPQANGLLLALERPVEGVTAGTNSRDADTLYNLSASGAGFIVRNNTMRGHRRYGVYLKAADGLVEGNTIDDVCSYGIVVSNEPEWPEGPVPRGIVVRGNRFIGTATSGGYAQSPQSAALQIIGRTLGFGVANSPIVRGVTVEDNTFVNPPGAAVFVGAARGVRIAGNRVEWRGAGKARASAEPFRTLHCADITLEENHVSGAARPAGKGARRVDRPHGRWEEMRPDELEAVLEAAPIAFVPLGTFEHHGWHLPVCFDGVKAHALCERVAERTGGAVLPTFFYGTGGGHIGYKWTFMLPEEKIAPLLETTLDHLAKFGFKVVVVLTGHYPKEQVDMAHRLAREAQQRHPGTRFIGLTEPEVTTPLPGDAMGGDHAAKYETSIALALRPEWVKLDALTPGRDAARTTLPETPRKEGTQYDPAHPLYAIWGQDPRTHASKETGEKLVEEIVSRLAAMVEAEL